MRVPVGVSVVVSLFFSLFFSLGVVASAADSKGDVKIRVVDPQGAAVAGAQVSLLGGGRILNTQTTAGDGMASFGSSFGQRYEVQVLAPGFAAETIEIGSAADSHG